MNIAYIGILKKTGQGDFILNADKDFFCLFKVSNRECIEQRAIEADVAILIAEKLLKARFNTEEVSIKYEGH